MMQEVADLVVALLPEINHRSLLLFLRFSVWIGAHPWLQRRLYNAMEQLTPSQHQSLQFQQLAKLYPRQARKPAMRQRGEQNSVVERCALRGAPQTGQVRPAQAAGTVRTRNQRFSAARHK